MPTQSLDNGTQVLDIPLNKISEAPGNVRTVYDQAEIEELAESIAQHGLLQPITVLGGPDVDGSDGTYAVYIGHRRYRALQWLRTEKRIKASEPIRCVVDNDGHSAGEMNGVGIARMLIENLQRVDISAIDEARGFAVMVEQHGYTQRDLAAAVGKSASHIAKRLALLGLPDDVQALIEHTVTIEQGYRLSQLDEDQIKKATKQIVKDGRTHNLDYDLQSMEQTRDKRRDSEKFKAYIDKNMLIVVDKLPTDLPRERFERLGWFDLAGLKQHDLKKNQILVANDAPLRSVSIYRQLTEKQAEAKQAREQAEREKARAERDAAMTEQEDDYADYIESGEATPHEVWEYQVGKLETEYEGKEADFRDAVEAALGATIRDLASKELGKYVMAVVASEAYNHAKRSCMTLGLHPPTEREDGTPISNWDLDWKGALREWIDGDTTRAVQAWLAAHVDINDITELDVFRPFRDGLAEQGIVPPEPFDAETTVGPEPWFDHETQEWRTDRPEQRVLLDGAVEPQEADFEDAAEYAAAKQTFELVWQAEQDDVRNAA